MAAGGVRITGGAFKGRAIKTVSGADPVSGYRPAMARVREAVCSMLEARGLRWPGTRVLDLFAGSGSLGFEALSRGAVQAWFVEKDRAAAACIGESAKHLGLGPDRVRVLCQDLFTFLRRRPQGVRFELICIDPPYGKDLLERALRETLEGGWLARGGMLLAEIEARLPLDPADWLGHGPLNPGLACVADRDYGQTRIVIWKDEANSPSTPGPSTP